MPEKPTRSTLRATIPVSIPVDDVVRIEDAAERLGKKRSEFIRDAAVEIAERVLADAAEPMAGAA
jgi:uncharacterized protein (DUF1778 family)